MNVDRFGSNAVRIVVRIRVDDDTERIAVEVESVEVVSEVAGGTEVGGSHGVFPCLGLRWVLSMREYYRPNPHRM